MFLVLWEFDVKPDKTERFEQVYGPGGDWESLFRSDSNYVETRLFRDTKRNATYLTADCWLTRNAYEEFLTVRRRDYKALDAATENLTLKERHLGSFEREDEKLNDAPKDRPSHRQPDRA